MSVPIISRERTTVVDPPDQGLILDRAYADYSLKRGHRPLEIASGAHVLSWLDLPLAG